MTRNSEALEHDVAMSLSGSVIQPLISFNFSGSADLHTPIHPLHNVQTPISN